MTIVVKRFILDVFWSPGYVTLLSRKFQKMQDFVCYIIFCFPFQEGAASAKLRLEESQRARRKDRNINRTVWEPLWFTLEENEYVECREWKFNNKYWNRDFSKCTEIF